MRHAISLDMQGENLADYSGNQIIEEILLKRVA
jgi:hypothetical protein